MKHVQLLEEAVSENGVTPFHNIDTPLVKGLCDIIGVLHRALEAQGLNSEWIKREVASNLE